MNVRMPDGTIISNVPDGTSQEEVFRRWQAMTPKAPASAPADPYVAQAEEDPWYKNLASGIGGAMLGPVVGAKQLLGIGSPDEVADWKKSMAGLWSQPMGKVGQIAGGTAVSAPLMAIPGAQSIPGAIATGAALGTVEPVGEGENRASNAAFGGAFGLAGQMAGSALGKAGGSIYNKAAGTLAARKAANAVRDATIAEGRAAGYVLPPSQVNPDAPMFSPNRLMEGFAGKLTTAQQAGLHNAPVTNELARKALGMPPGSTISTKALQGIRSEAGKAYEALKEVPHFTVDADYGKALGDIFGEYRNLAVEFPGRTNHRIEQLISDLNRPQFSSGSVVNLVKDLRYNGFRNVKSPDPQVSALGRAELGAQSALEDLIDRNLAQTGNQKLLSDYRAARRLIAKSYTVENALEESTGNIVASKIAREYSKGRPLSAELETVGKMAEAFPKALQNMNTSAPGVSPLDAVSGVIAMGATGRPEAALAPLMRPVARSTILSQPWQRLIAKPPNYEPGAVTKALKALDDERMRQLIQAGTTGGLLVFPQ